jgi:hypothetical protein
MRRARLRSQTHSSSWNRIAILIRAESIRERPEDPRDWYVISRVARVLLCVRDTFYMLVRLLELSRHPRGTMMTKVHVSARPEAVLIEWFRESRWRAHVINAARCVTDARSGTVQGRVPRRPSIGVRPEAAREVRGAAGPMIPQAGCIATFVTP